MKIAKDIIAIRKLLHLTQHELANLLNVSYLTINRWENEANLVEISNAELIYEFAFKRGIFLNLMNEQIYKEEHEINKTRVLFHGCTKQIDAPIDLKHSRKHNDFGKGFYLSEGFSQAAIYVAESSSFSFVYVFSLDCSSLNVYQFSVSLEWMLVIAYFRGWLNEYVDTALMKDLLKKLENIDLIISPIADNRMFDLISEFVKGEITDEQCQHALAATNLGMQYVLKSQKAIDNLALIKECLVSKSEKEQYKNKRQEFNSLNQNKVKLSRINYRGKGKYIDEVFK